MVIRPQSPRTRLRLRSIVVGIVGAFVFALLLFGCGSDTAATSTDVGTVPMPVDQTTPPPEIPDPVPAAVESCTVTRYGNDIRVTFGGVGALATCDSAVQSWSGGGDFWQLTTEAAQGRLSMVCELVGPTAGVSVVVEDSGAATYGTTICGNLTKNGWVAVGGTDAGGAVASREAEASAQANADEAARAVLDDVDTLMKDAGYSADAWQNSGATKADLAEMARDVELTRADARKTAAHGAAHPDGAFGEVCAYASTTRGDQGTVEGRWQTADFGLRSVEDLMGDLRTGLSSLESDLQVALDAGAAAPSTVPLPADEQIQAARSAANRALADLAPKVATARVTIGKYRRQASQAADEADAVCARVSG